MDDVGGRKVSLRVREIGMRRWSLALAGLIVGLAASWLLLPRFLTPEEAEQLRSAPEPDPVTAPVEEGILREVIQLEAIVVARSQTGVQAVQPPSAQRVVLTYLPEPGTPIHVGEVVVALSGRPIIFLGNMPNLFRDLHRGMTGSDISEFQGFLVAQGLAESESFEPSVFDEAMEDAVEALYASLGYPTAPPPTVVTDDMILSARSTVDQATQALATARQSGDQISINVASRNLTTARRKRDQLLASPRLSVPASETVGLPHDMVVVVGSGFTVGAVVPPGATAIEIRTAGVFLHSLTSRARTLGVFPGQAATVFTPDERVSTRVEQVTPRTDNPSESEIILTWDRDGFVPGERLVIEIETASSRTPVISVPLAAVRTDADGTTYVIVATNGSTHRVAVTTSVTIGGRTAVQGDLTPGQQVVVGNR